MTIRATVHSAIMIGVSSPGFARLGTSEEQAACHDDVPHLRHKIKEENGTNAFLQRLPGHRAKISLRCRDALERHGVSSLRLRAVGDMKRPSDAGIPPSNRRIGERDGRPNRRLIGKMIGKVKMKPGLAGALAGVVLALVASAAYSASNQLPAHSATNPAHQIPAHSTPNPTVAGFWAQVGDDGRVGGWFYFVEKNGAFEGRLVKMFMQPGAQHIINACEKCTGDQKNAPMLGLTIIKGMKREGYKYQEGSILDPRDGTVYHALMEMSPDGQKLSVRGYLGIPLLGQTQVWNRLPDDAIAADDIPKESLSPGLSAE
jgi:uncharacterized protein (DUF2147 family)